jgi:DNA invertase Pin-like site-specific DNA recombinase
MLTDVTAQKIRGEHLDRPALIYVRQSTPFQVRENTASTARQYDLVRRASDLGWPKHAIQVIDQDQGLSGASTADREGFRQLITQVSLGQAGAVFSLEASRLARSCSDWHRLLEICALTGTLVIDEEGVYDPMQYGDRLLLGILGTMSEAELHWLRSRLLGGRLERARNGEFRMKPPIGLVYDPVGRLVLDPDEQVQDALRLLFEVFDHSSSAMAVVKHFLTNNLQFPRRIWSGARKGQVVWAPLKYARVVWVLHHPSYAGIYVYGRTKTVRQGLVDGTCDGKVYRHKVKPDDWPIVIPDHHSGYITVEQYQLNQKRLDENRTFLDKDRRGAPREGAGLLQGIVRCGRCGRRMSVRYRERSNVIYACAHIHSHFGLPYCQSFRGDQVDAAVAQAFLEAMQPAQLEVSMAAIDQLAERSRKIDRQWQLALERLRYEANLAERRFKAVDPENRLVARSLECDWNEKLTEVERLERENLQRPNLLVRLVDPAERQRILALAQDLPRLWNASTTTNTERKRLLSFLIKDVTLYAEKTTIEIAIRWQTEACTTLEVPRFLRIWDLRRTDPAVVDRIRTLASTQTDAEIVAELNKCGFRSGSQSAFTISIVRQLRAAYGIKSACPVHPRFCAEGRRGDGRYSARAVAELLGCDMSTVVAWCRIGKLDGIQTMRAGPWWINLTAENIAVLSQPNEEGQRSDGRYTARAAAALLNRHPRTIALWCRSGRLNGIQASRNVGWWVQLTPKEIEELKAD